MNPSLTSKSKLLCYALLFLISYYNHLSTGLFLEVRGYVSLVFEFPTMLSTVPGTDVYGLKNVSSPSCFTHMSLFILILKGKGEIMLMLTLLWDASG